MQTRWRYRKQDAPVPQVIDVPYKETRVFKKRTARHLGSRRNVGGFKGAPYNTICHKSLNSFQVSLHYMPTILVNASPTFSNIAKNVFPVKGNSFSQAMNASTTFNMVTSSGFALSLDTCKCTFSISQALPFTQEIRYYGLSAYAAIPYREAEERERESMAVGIRLGHPLVYTASSFLDPFYLI